MEEKTAKRKGSLSVNNWGPKKARCSALTLAKNWATRKVQRKEPKRKEPK